MLEKLPEQITDLTEIQNFCDEKHPESRFLDYKEDYSASSNANYKIAKIVSAMANAHGGWILFGIKEEKDTQNRGIAGDITGISKSSGLGQRIKQICLDSINPPITPLVGSCDVDSDREVVLVRIFESDSTPHELVRDGKVYIRTNDISHLADDGKEASVRDIELLLNRRIKSIDLRNRLLKRAEERCQKDTRFTQISFSCIPTFPDEPICSYEKLIEAAQGLKKFDCFYGVGTRVQSAHEAVSQTFLRRGGNEIGEQDTSFDVTLYGSLYFRTLHYSTTELPVGAGIGIEALGSAGLLYALLQSSDWFLRELEFNGLVDLSFGLHCPDRLTATVVPPQHMISMRKLDRVLDKEFSITRRVLTTDFYNLDFIENMFREYLWASGLGPEAWTWDRPKELIKMIHDQLKSRGR